MKLLTRLNVVDLSCLLVLSVSAAGFLLAEAGHAGANKAIKGKAQVAISIFFSGIKTKDAELFKNGETASLTIRNVPVEPPMTITQVKETPKQVSFLTPDGKKVVAFPDPSQPLAHDYVVTVTDTAEVTGDGFVVRGNKLKIGNQVELESFKYRVQGVVVDITARQQ